MIVLDAESLFNRLADDVDLDPFTRKYCISRLRSEGIGFLTVTLPALSKAVLASLEKGYFDRPTHFAWKGRTLRYFRFMLNKIFDRNGMVRQDVCPIAIWQIRQLCEYFYKLALPFDEEDLSKATESFIDEDSQLAACPFDADWVEELRKKFETFYPNISNATVSSVYSRNRPRPGSGTFAGCHSLNGRYFLLKEDFTGCLDEDKPFMGYFKPYPAAPVKVTVCEEDTSDFSEVLFVPKDSRGPRTICREPYLRLLPQMAFHDWLKDALERFTDNHVNFKSQQINRDLAEAASISKEWSTIDLKSASDRVDKVIMSRIFRNSPACRYFLSKRTGQAVLPDGRTMQLRKVAGMGSGLTFPLMSLLVYLTIVNGIQRRTGLSWKKASTLVYVYGDDVIVKTAHYNLALECLAKVKLNANPDKCFTHSFFRESCGGDYYMGSEVAPVRLKLTSTGPICNGNTIRCVERNSSIVELNAHAKELRKAGLIGLAELYYRLIEAEVGPLPTISGDSSVIGRWQSIPPSVYKIDETGMYECVRVLVSVPEQLEASLDPYIYLSRGLGRIDNRRSPRAEKLKKLQELFSDPPKKEYGWATVPKSIKLRRTKKSAFALIG